MDPVAPGNEPAAVPAPAAPAEPAAPAPTAPEAPQLTPEQQDAQEWDDAAKELFPTDEPVNKEEPKDEPTKPETSGEEKPADKDAAKTTPPDAEQEPGDDAAKKDAEEAGKPDPADAAREARAATREYAKQVETVKADVIKQIAADIPKQLQDADGDPINGIEDVMKLVNPRTSQTFTEEEAGMWLLSAQQQLNQQHAAIEKQAEQIAELNVDIKDQADAINAKYGEYLKANTDLRDELWAEWQETLVKDPKTGLIVKMPVPLEKYYERNLAPRLTAERTQQQTAADQKAAEEKAAKEAAEQRDRKRQDRSDIYGNGKVDTRSDDQKEWDAAGKAVFG